MLAHSKRFQVSSIFLLTALLLFVFGDFAITTLHPFLELQKFLMGIFYIDFSQISQYGDALFQTVLIALIAIFVSSILGFVFALFYHFLILRVVLAFLRSIHELFWALIFLQIFGLNQLTALLAIIIPYSATLGKVYAEILQDNDTFPQELRSSNISNSVLFIYTKLPDAFTHIVSYTSYRFECALKSTAILGFIGLPTLGYYLEGAFMQGYYNDVWLLLILFYLLIASLKYWFTQYTIMPLAIVSMFFLDKFDSITWSNFTRFFTQDIVPAPIKNNQSFAHLLMWLKDLFGHEVLPGIYNTIILTQVALIATALVTLLLYPLISVHLSKKPTRFFGNILLVVLRSTPEYILAYLFLQIFGVSMLPAVFALMLHNGSIIAYIIGNQSNKIDLRIDALHKKINKYSYEITPRIYNSFLSFLFYRWEIIMRESAILGILGVQTLGFFIDSSIAEFKLDKMFILLLCTASLNILIDQISYRVRNYIALSKEIKTAHITCAGID